MVVLYDIAPLEHILDSLLTQTLSSVDVTPALLVHDETSRRNHELSLNSATVDATDSKAAFTRLKEKFDTLGTIVDRRLSALKFARAPVSCLATETLQSIFTLVVRQGAKSSRHKRNSTSALSIRLSHVCARWRSVALEMQELWQLVLIPDGCPDMFEVFASRCSRSRTLEVSRLELGARSKYHQTFGFSFDKVQFSLIGKLTLGGTLSEAFVQSLFRDSEDLDAHILRTKSLTVHSGASYEKKPPSGFVSVLAPQSLSLHNADPTFIGRLVSPYYLSDITFFGTPYAQISKTLERLVTHDAEEFCMLRIENGVLLGEGDDFKIEAPYNAAHLVCLELVGCEMQTVYCVFTEWKMDRLNSLLLSQWGSEDDDTVGDLGEYVEWFDRAFCSLCTHSPRIASLSLSVEALVFCALSLILGIPSNLPCLEELTLEVDDWDDEDPSSGKFCSVLNIIKRRVEATSERTKGFDRKTPIRELIVSRDLVPEDDVSTLRQLVKVFSFGR